ncbi:MAG: penicillin-binding protein 2 [Gaiellaceae bacterium]
MPEPTGPERFLPPDPRVTEPSWVTPQTLVRAGLLGLLALVVFAILVMRLWALQILSGASYEKAAQQLQLRTVRIQAPRGVVLDATNHILVGNRISKVVVVWPGDLPKLGQKPNRYQVLKRVAKILEIPLRPLVKEVEARAGLPLDPIVVKKDVDYFTSAYIKEHADQLPGVKVGRAFVRWYPRGSLAAHVLGSVGEVSKQQLAQDKSGALQPGDIVGRSGVELAMDSWLRGVPGLAKQTVDALGRVQGDVKETRAEQPGDTVRLTLNLAVQKSAEDALQYGIQLARNQKCSGCWNANAGAIIALDPRDGSVLAMASYPTFPPRVYAGNVTNRTLNRYGLLNQAIAEKMHFPGLNRVTSVGYPPGSTFKPMTAIAGLQMHLISPTGPLHCTGSFQIKGQTFMNWDPYANSWMDLPTALAASCDTYFYQVGLDFYDLPKQYGSPLQRIARRFGFGESSGLDIGGDIPGLLPTPAWRRAAFTAKTDPNWQIDSLWKPGDSVQLAIGQKDLLVTPLQMARFYSAIANGGRLVTPHVVADVEQGDHVVNRPVPPAPKNVDVSPGVLGAVRDGLYQATHSPEGTSTPVFGNFPLAIAGKTGTAEKYSAQYKRTFDESWWCGYGPFDSPQLVVCAVIENGGHGGTAAAPAAAKVFETFFHLKHVASSQSLHSD